MKKLTILIYLTLIFGTSTLLGKYTQNTSTLQINSETRDYGEHTTQIETLLSIIPIGAEIYLEEQESGDWYLKIEKTFTTEEQEGKIQKAEPLYIESILI